MNNERRRSLLSLLALSSDDHKIAKLLHERLLDTAAEKIVEDFYAYLQEHSEYIALLNPKLIPSLKVTQISYLRSFGVDFDSSDYFNNRLQVGFVHKKVGVTLSLYQCAYRELQQLMLNVIPEGFQQDGITGRDVCCFIHKITTLDMTLAIETYHYAELIDIQDELDDVYVEKAELREQVITDSLTGLFSKDHGISRLRGALSRKSERQELCLIMADIDYFKDINDSHGHLAGDEVLRQVGKLLNSAVRDFDTVSRFGGEEFMIVLCKATTEIAMKVANRIRQLVRGNPVQYDGNKIEVTISQGIAVADDASDTMQLISASDKALYNAKQQGRDCVVMSGANATRC